MKQYKLFNANINKIGLSKWIINECNKNEIFSATPVQQACIPPILNRKDLIVYSKTGTGKTLTFILPILHLIDLHQISFNVFILVPTRELGLQINDTFNRLGKIKKISSCFLFKTKFYFYLADDKSYLIKNERVFITTLRYLYQMLNQKTNNKKINMLIIDESDLILDKKSDILIEKIFSRFDIEQILLFAASIHEKFSVLYKLQYCKSIFYYQEKKNRYFGFSNIRQEYLFCPSFLKIFYTEIILKYKFKFFPKRKNFTLSGSIIFVASKKKCEKLFLFFKKIFVRVGRLHSNMESITRLLTMQMLISGKINLLICTDLGHRGLDCSFIDLVINYDFPKNINTYIHRAGRVGRFEKNGHCINLISPEDIPYFHFLEQKIGCKIKKFDFINDASVLQLLARQNKKDI